VAGGSKSSGTARRGSSSCKLALKVLPDQDRHGTHPGVVGRRHSAAGPVTGSPLLVLLWLCAIKLRWQLTRLVQTNANAVPVVRTPASNYIFETFLDTSSIPSSTRIYSSYAAVSHVKDTKDL
jgi:hypothetical protein